MSNERECPVCNGTGWVPEQVEWSDGLGMTRTQCPLCDGKGTLGKDPVRLAVDFKQRAQEAEAKLIELRTFVALYMKCVELDKTHPTDIDVRCSVLQSMGLIYAPQPSPWTQTWVGYLKQAAARANLPT